jgi:hypothetical protein
VDDEGTVAPQTRAAQSEISCRLEQGSGIDNNLGGGVKDSYINVRAPTRRRRMFEMAGDESSTFCEEVTPEYAADRLHAAMAELECPQLPDQLRSVTMSRALLHSRVRLMHGSLS